MGAEKPRGQWVLAVLDGVRVYRGVDDLLLGAHPIELTELQQVILETLLEGDGRSSDVESLIRSMWPDGPPHTARTSLQNQISRIRKQTSESFLVTTNHGYRLACSTDLDVLAEITREVTDHLERGDFDWDEDRLHHAMLYVRRCEQPLQESSALLIEQLETTNLSALVESGKATTALGEGERLVRATPFNERRWWLLARAYQSAGRRSEALATIDRARRLLRTELGISIGGELAALESTLLRSERLEILPPAIPLVGRDDLVHSLFTTCLNDGQCVLAGESGSGRSVVLRELRARLRRKSRRVAYARCDVNSSSATAVFDDLLDDLGENGSWPADAVEGFIIAMIKAAVDGPLTLIVDDIDNAGPSVVNTLARCAMIPGVSVVCSTTTGTEFEALSHFRWLKLPVLDHDSSRLILDHLTTLQPSLSDEVKESVIALAGGNPTVLSVLLVDQAFLAAIGEGEAVDVSAGRSDALEILVVRLTSRLNTAGRLAVEAAAVLGSGSTTAVLEKMSGGGGLAEAFHTGLLVRVSEGRFRFASEAIGRAIYERLRVGRRVDLHLAAANLSRALGEPIEQVAHHAFRASSLSPKGAVEACCEAGTAAGNRGLHHDSLGWFERAMRIMQETGSTDHKSMIRARVGLGNAMRLIGDPRHLAELISVTKDAIEWGDRQLIADATYALLQLGGVSGPGSEQGEALKMAHQALRLLDGTEWWALIAAAITQVESVFAPRQNNHSLFLRAMDIAKSDDIRRRVLPYAYLELGHPRDLPLRERVTAELKEIASRTLDPFTMFSASQQDLANCFVRNDMERIMECLNSLRNLVHQTGSVGHRWETKYAEAAVLDILGEIDASMEASREAFETFGRVMPLRAEAVWVSQQFGMLCKWGDVSELEPVLASIRDRQPTLGAWLPLHAYTCFRSHPDTARREIEQSLGAVPEDFTWLASHTVGGMVAAHLNDIALCGCYLTMLEPWADLVASPVVSVFWPVRRTIDALKDVVTPAR